MPEPGRAPFEVSGNVCLEEFCGFQPTPEVRTSGQLVGHLADSNVMLCSMALGEKKEPWTVEKTKTSKADLVKGIALFGFDTTRFALVGLIIGHEFEHHGNMVTHMRKKGLVPPSSEPPPPKAPAPK